MKRIKVIATLFILFSASLMNYHDRSLSSVSFVQGSEMVVCAEKAMTKEVRSCNHNETDYSGAEQKTSSGKNYEATMIIL